MKLYATTTSERATKGQGGNNYLKIEVKDEKQEVIMKIDVDFTIKGLDYTFWADPQKLREIKIKGEKQKGDFCPFCKTKLKQSDYMCPNENCPDDRSKQ